jgi:hypothetical protein
MVLDSQNFVVPNDMCCGRDVSGIVCAKESGAARLVAIGLLHCYVNDSRSQAVGYVSLTQD